MITGKPAIPALGKCCMLQHGDAMVNKNIINGIIIHFFRAEGIERT
jgi:hypothetical protein